MRRYTQALTTWDYETIAKLRHRDWKAVWPQSGEVVNSTAADQMITDGYPGGRPTLVPGRMVGSEDRWVTSPMGGAFRVSGDGDSWWGEWRMTYPDGKTWFTVTLLELLEGAIWRETTYWAEPFDAPQWRRDFVERLQQS